MVYDQLASAETVQKTAEAIRARGIKVEIVDTKEQALEKVKAMIPQGVSVNNGSSTTLQEIGFVDYLKAGQHGWNNLHAAILAETDPAKQAALRQQSVFADYFLASVHGISQNGEIVVASASGSQLPSDIFTSKHVIWVAGTQKIVPTLADALDRLRTYVYPLEDARMKSTGAAGTSLSKICIFEQEPAFMQREVTLILVNEKLGF